jgi:tripartite-type tricarboxylate transporter receptor subunit TctC
LNRRKLLQIGVVTSVGTLFLPSARRARAQPTYPDHAVRLVVPRPAGGVVDVIAREWSDKVSATFGATYIDNIGGGGGTIGAAFAARAPADGYTLLFGTTSELVLSPMFAHESYDPVASFEPIAIICESVAAIVVNPSVPASDLNMLVAYARQHPDGLSYGSAGAGTVSNLAGELFKRLANLRDITHVPYRGGGPAMSDLIAGHIPIMTPMMTETIIALHRQGQIKVLAVASQQRLKSMPDIATAAEQGYPELIARLFVGLFAPAKTPKPIVARVEDVTQRAMQDLALQKSFAAAGFESVTNSDAATAARYLDSEIVRWRPIVEQVGLRQE